MNREDREAPGPPPRYQQANGVGGGGKVKQQWVGDNSEEGWENNFGSRRIFVGNLAYPVGWPQLKDTFRECGEVVYADVMRGPNGRSKGCGIVEFSTPEEAALAVRALNDREIRCDGLTVGYTNVLTWSSLSWFIFDHFSHIALTILPLCFAHINFTQGSPYLLQGRSRG